MLSVILGSLSVISACLLLWQWHVARRFPLHFRPLVPARNAPGVSVLKPLKGFDSETADCLRSWFTQDYPGPVQLLLGVASDDDPVAPIVRQLLAEFSGSDARLVVCRDRSGPNAKACKLLHLSSLARHETVVVSDADVWAPPDLLISVAALLQESEVGLVNCFYQLATPATLAMRWEAIAVNADFWSQVLQSRSIKPLDFALGAVIALKRQALRDAGGFAPLVNQLADDYQLGRLVSLAGWRIALCPVIVECREAPRGWREIWAHQVRWTRTIRVCQPIPYFFSILANATLWPVMWLALCPGFHTLAVVTALLLGRIVIALDLQRRFTRTAMADAYWWLVPVKDLLGAALWAWAFCGDEIVWRGEKYRVRNGGTME